MSRGDVRLSTRITLSALVLVAIGALVLMFLEEARLRDAYLRERQAHLAETLHANEVRLTQAIDELRRDTLFLANTPPVSGIARAALANDFDVRGGNNTRERWNERLQQIFSAYLASHPDYDQAAYVGMARGGRELVRVERQGDEIAVVAPGDLEAWGERPHFRAAAERPAGRVYLSEFENVSVEPEGAEQPVMHAMVPIRAPDGSLFGVVVVSARVRHLLETGAVVPTRGVLAYVADEVGRYLFHPGGTTGAVGGTRIQKDFPATVALHDPYAPRALPLQAFAAGAGVEYLAALRIHFDADDPYRYLVLAYHLPQDLGAAAAARIPVERIVEGFAALLLVCAVVFVVLRRTFAPLEQLTEVARGIAAGRRELPVFPASGGAAEIGSLTRALHGMLTELAQREQEISSINAGLERQVRERTAELSAANARLHDEVAERKRAEQALRIAAAAFETRDAIVITDADSNIVRVNRAFTEITGYAEEEVIGRNPRIMSSGRHDAVFYAEMWRQLLQVGSWVGEVVDRRKDGKLYPKWLTITAVRNEGGETTHYVGIFSDITVRKQAEEEIRSLAFYDPLTRLPNRRLFVDRLRAVLAASSRHRDHGAVLFIDLDRFKSLNDSLGHDYGDLMLVEVASRLKACVREMDTVARLGGDEFVVLLEAVSHDRDDASHKVGLVAEKIRAALARPYRLREHEHHSSPSVGVVLFAGSAETPEVLLKHADMAMYQAKESGRNAVRFFDPAMQESAAARAALERDLHQALACRQLALHYQLQVDHAQRPVGAEALLRWHHPERGLILPGEFLPVAEEGALSLEIGQWVLESACRQLESWARHPRLQALTLAVNIGRKQFVLPDFVERVAVLLQAHRFEPARLRLELIEHAVLDDPAGAVQKMQALRELGVQLSMDEFVTGYSTLSWLKRLPLDQIKIDQAFVQNSSRDCNDALLVRTIIELAGNVRVNVIAEGVETEQQLDFLRHNACAAFQGFLFGRPVAIDEFERLLETVPAQA